MVISHRQTKKACRGLVVVC